MTKFTYHRNLSLSVVSMIFAIGLAFSYLIEENGGFPHKSELIELQGYVSWVEERDYGISFGLTTHDFNFDYPSKANGQGVVLDALLNSEGKLVRFSYLPRDPSGPIYNDVKYYKVLELFVDEVPIRTYEETEDAWKADNQLMPFIFILFFGGSIYVWRKTKQEFKPYY